MLNPLKRKILKTLLSTQIIKILVVGKKAFKLCGKEAGIDNSVLEETISNAKTAKPQTSPKKKREREGEEEETSKRRKTSQSPPREVSPRRTARHASIGGEKKKTTPKKKTTTPKKPTIIKPLLEANETLLGELSSLLHEISY